MRAQPIQQRAQGTSETARRGYIPVSASGIVTTACIALAVALAFVISSGGNAQDDVFDVPIPSKAPLIPELPNRNPLIEGETGENAAEEREEQTEEAETGADGGEQGEDHAQEEAEDGKAAASEIETAETPPAPLRKPPPPKNLRTYEAPIGPPQRPAEWSSEEIAEAREQCGRLLAKAIFDFEELDPIRKGICGTPAPISLNSVSAGETVSIRPAAKLNCTMASYFHRWMVEIVQPSARTHLETEITGVINVASYHCRTRYNDPSQRISQHAFANALDLAGFITAKGEQITVEKFWKGETPQSLFLREIHAGACKLFGTVLGPEANAAHHDHFHLDMTKRRHGSYCE